jgi:type IV pilus assembly protein PilO
MKQVDMQAQADVIKIELAALPGMRENVSGYKNSLADLSSRFYPDIIQEKLILQLDDMVKQSGIIASVYSYTLQQGLTISEIQIGNQNDPVEADSITENSDEASETDTTETTEADLNEQPTESTITDAKLLSANIQFSGTFDQLRKFITLVEDTNMRKMVNRQKIQLQILNRLQRQRRLQRQKRQRKQSRQKRQKRLLHPFQRESEAASPLSSIPLRS